MDRVLAVVLIVLCLVLAVLVWLMRRGPRTVRVFGGGTRRRRGTQPAKTRGEEVDAAASQPPAVLRAGLPGGEYAFDLTGAGSVRRVPPIEGLYYGISGRGRPGRATLLTPGCVEWAARMTSGRVYSWVVVDSPEACYAVRADPVAGRVAAIDADALAGWLTARLGGEPPHKIGLREYVGQLRRLGLTVVVGAQRDKEVRFNLVDVTSAAERARATRALAALDGPAFEALDWKAYDQTVGRAACTEAREVSGDVAIDLATRKVTAPKMRTGRLYASFPGYRAYITFHTHPSARYRGTQVEEPSTADLWLAMNATARQGMVWHFVTAPEGSYILRPSQQLQDHYSTDPEGARHAVEAAYRGGLRYDGGVRACARDVERALREAGFIAYFREAPCMPLLDRPDIRPRYNVLSRVEHSAAVEELRHTSGPALLGADWTRVVQAHEAPEISGAWWASAYLRGGVVTPTDGHSLDPMDEETYPFGAPGPLMVIAFDDEDFPAGIPAAAMNVARARAEEWPWMALLSPSRVLVFRANATGLEVYGPRVFRPSRRASRRKATIRK